MVFLFIWWLLVFFPSTIWQVFFFSTGSGRAASWVSKFLLWASTPWPWQTRNTCPHQQFDEFFLFHRKWKSSFFSFEHFILIKPTTSSKLAHKNHSWFFLINNRYVGMQIRKTQLWRCTSRNRNMKSWF